MVCLYRNPPIIGHKLCNMLNEIILQNELQHFIAKIINAPKGYNATITQQRSEYKHFRHNQEPGPLPPQSYALHLGHQEN